MWSWTIKPDLTPIFLGAGYGAGAYFFLRTFLGERWPPSSAGVFGAAFFATLMLIATLIHWDRFNHGDAPTLAAIAFYGWVDRRTSSRRSRSARCGGSTSRTDSGEPLPGEPLVPPQRAARARGCSGSARSAPRSCSSSSPTTAIDLWPWQLTPLTSRVLGSFTAQVGAGALLLSTDPRWGSWRLLRADVLRRGRAAPRRRRPRLGRLRYRQRADLSLRRRAGRADAGAGRALPAGSARQRPYASGGAPRRRSAAARARPGA